jgi:phosphonopyruvate decarboxylase
MLLLVGWRGEPNNKDEPQHMKQGRIMKDLLKTLEIPFDNVNPNLSSTQILNVVNALIEKSFKNKSPVVLLVSKGTFEDYTLKSSKDNSFKLLREEVIQLIAESILNKDVIVSTTGLASRELFEFRASTNQSHSQDFLTVGGMGHASQIALGIAIQKKDRRVYCLDGDGALLMHMGSLVTNGSLKSQNFTHVLLNNSSHESVGGQPTPCNDIKIHKIAKEVGFDFCETVRTKEELITCIKKTQNFKGSVFIDVKLKNGFRPNLGRPTKSPIQNKTDLMQFLNQ